MEFTQVSAEVIVDDHDHAVAWYQRLLGRAPDGRPMDGLAEWRLTDNAWLQVFADPDRAGCSTVTLGVAHIEPVVTALEEADIDFRRMSTKRGQELALVNDPDGNGVVFAQDI